MYSFNTPSVPLPLQTVIKLYQNTLCATANVHTVEHEHRKAHFAHA